MLSECCSSSGPDETSIAVDELAVKNGYEQRTTTLVLFLDFGLKLFLEA